MAESNIVINVKAMTGKAVKALTKTTSAFKRLGKSVADNRMKVVGATVAMTGAIVKSVMAFDEQTLAINALNLALRNQGNFTEEASRGIQQLASAQQEVTRFGDEVTLAAAAQAAQFGLTGEQIMKLIPLTQDFAAATGKGLGTSFLDVAKAMDGQISMLSRYGIKTNESMTATERMTIVTGGLAKMFGGQARLQADNFSGSLVQVGNEVGDVFEVIGEQLAPAMKALIDTVKDTVKWFKDLDPVWKKVTAGGLALGAIAGTLLLSISALAAALPMVTAGFATMGITMAGVGTAMTTVLLPALAAVAVGIAAYKLTEWAMEWTGLRKHVDAAAMSLWKWEMSASDADTQMNALVEASIIADREITNLGEAVEILTAHNMEMQEEVTGVATVLGVVDTKAEKVTGTVSRLTVEFDDLQNSALELRAAQLGVAESAEWGWYQENRLAAAFENAKKEVGETTSALVPATRATMDLTEATVEWGDVTSNITGLMGDVGNVLSVFGINIDGVIGKVTRLISSFDSMLSSVSGIMGALGGGGIGGGGGLSGLLGGLFGGGGEVATGTTTAATGGGGLASIFGGLGTKAAAFFSNPFTIGVGAALAGFFIVKNLFGGPSQIERVATESADYFGLQISKDLQWHMVNVSEKLGIPISDAMIATTDLVAKELADMGQLTTEAMDMLAPKMRDVFALLERGAIDSSEAARILQDGIFQIIPEFDNLSDTAKETFMNLINDAQAWGIEGDALTELAALLGMTLEDAFSGVPAAVSEAGAAASGLAGAFDDVAASAKHAGDEIASIPGSPKGVSAQGGFFSPALPTDLTIQAHRGERVSITPAGGGGGGGGGGTTIVQAYLTLDGRIIDKKIIRTVNKAGRLGDLDLGGASTLVDPRA